MQPQQPKNIRWGIIGLGNIANTFAQDLSTVEDCELYAVASRAEEKAIDFAKKHQASRAYGSYEALVEDPNVDAVYVATPHALHQQNTLLCLQKGIAVLCEKPFAMNSLEVSRMIDVAKKKNVLLMEAMWTYFLPQYQFVLAELANKTYGKLLKVEADFGFKAEFDERSRLFRKSLGGGSLLDIGIYPIFVALSTLGRPDTTTESATFFDNGADSSCSMVFNYKNGAKAELKSTLLTNTPTEAIFYCEQGIIKINNGFYRPSTVTMLSGNNKQTLNFNCEQNGYIYEIKHFNELLRQGKTESDLMTFDFSLELIKTLDHIRKVIGLKY